MTVAPAGVVERLRDLADRGKALVAEGSPGTVDLIELRAETASGLAEVEAALAHEDRSHTVIPDGLRSASAARVIRYLTVHECLLDVLDGIDARLFGSLSLLVSRLRTGDRDSRRQALVDAVRAATHHPVTAAVARQVTSMCPPHGSAVHSSSGPARSASSSTWVGTRRRRPSPGISR
nr:hypothetical protein [Gordonia sp. NB41Y]KOY49565.1 hypothetical protein ISGA_09345 [Gordonia sp. NB41Y]